MCTLHCFHVIAKFTNVTYTESDNTAHLDPTRPDSAQLKSTRLNRLAEFSCVGSASGGVK